MWFKTLNKIIIYICSLFNHDKLIGFGRILKSYHFYLLRQTPWKQNMRVYYYTGWELYCWTVYQRYLRNYNAATLIVARLCVSQTADRLNSPCFIKKLYPYTSNKLHTEHRTSQWFFAYFPYVKWDRLITVLLLDCIRVSASTYIV